MIDVHNLSYWEKESFAFHSDFLIIGSGIVGLSTAIYLKQREPDKKVTVLERGFLPSGASTKNAGFSCIGSPSELLDDLTKNSEEEVFATVAKRWKGLLNLNDLLGKDNIGYQALGSYELFDDGSAELYEKCLGNLNYLNKQLEQVTGKPIVFQKNDSICENSGFGGFNRAISHAAEGQIDTGKMMKTLLNKACSLEINILNGIEVKDLSEKAIETNFGKFPYDKLIVCTNGFSKRFFPNMDVEPARAQVVVTNEIPDLKFEGIYHFDQGYYYFRNIGKRILFGGGRNLDFEGETTTDMNTTDKIISHLKKLLSEKIIPNTPFEIEHQWAGTMGVGQNKSPIIQKLDNNIYCGIRLGGMGVAIGSLVGKELAKLILED
ncbi:FAD-binding oxidoreductase [Paracrocinitomix mangrovi]|uniref:NAD(P)/FAD-dependent oxidoreductase n=1 Tax=Paracrocinitomix mangrovi TaxID=2862509 RepID=UPI001C8DEFA6|nr:FAD-dependent oxidoreductase [Paracrocinitomix mangrovi]UKN01318.1 FAD-binding oxidoreductase [Paracrocinitomix mangrovi]